GLAMLRRSTRLSGTDHDPLHVTSGNRDVQVLFGELSGGHLYARESLGAESGSPDLEGIGPGGQVGEQEPPLRVGAARGGAPRDLNSRPGDRPREALDPDMAEDRPRSFGWRSLADDQERSPRPIAQHQSMRLENPLRDVPGKAGRGIGQHLKL